MQPTKQKPNIPSSHPWLSISWSSSHGYRALLRFLRRSYNCVVAKVWEIWDRKKTWEREKKKAEEIGNGFLMVSVCHVHWIFFSTYYVPWEREGIFPERVVKTWGVWTNGGQVPWEMADNWRCHTQQQRIVDWFIAMVPFLPFFGTSFGMVPWTAITSFQFISLLRLLVGFLGWIPKISIDELLPRTVHQLEPSCSFRQGSASDH